MIEWPLLDQMFFGFIDIGSLATEILQSESLLGLFCFYNLNNCMNSHIYVAFHGEYWWIPINVES